MQPFEHGVALFDSGTENGECVERVGEGKKEVWERRVCVQLLQRPGLCDEGQQGSRLSLRQYNLMVRTELGLKRALTFGIAPGLKAALRTLARAAEGSFTLRKSLTEVSVLLSKAAARCQGK